MVINRIGPMSCAKISGALSAILGIIIGGVFSLIALAGVERNFAVLLHIYSAKARRMVCVTTSASMSYPSCV